MNYGAYVAECDRRDGVDIDRSSDPNGAGCTIGWTTAGEWLEYDLDTPAPRTVDLGLHVASDLLGRQFHLTLDGASLAEQTVPSDGTWSPVAVTYSGVALSAGQHAALHVRHRRARLRLLRRDGFHVSGCLLRGRTAPRERRRILQESATYPASFAIDGDPSTRWSSAFTDPQWIDVDLGQQRRVDRIVLSWEVAASRQYELSVSTSSEGPWQVVASSSTG